MLNECLLNVFTILLTLESCSSMKRCGIRSPHTVKYSLIHAIEMYLIVFMLNKSLSEPESAKSETFLIMEINLIESDAFQLRKGQDPNRGM